MYHLAPAPRVLALGNPASPVVERLLKSLAVLASAGQVGHQVAVACAFQHELDGFARLQRKGRAHASLLVLMHVYRRGQAEAERLAFKNDAMLKKMDLVGIAGKVKRGTADHLEGERAAYHSHRADNIMLVVNYTTELDGHKIGDFAHAINGEETSNQDIRLRQVELFASHAHIAVEYGGDAKEAAFAGIEQRAKDAGRIEPWDTAPVDRAVFANQRDGVQVADDRVIFDGKIVFRGFPGFLLLFCRHTYSF